MPRARAELISSLEDAIRNTCAWWRTAATVSLISYLFFIPLSAILSRETVDAEILWVFPGALIIFSAPILLSRVGLVHARWSLRRNLARLMAEAAKKHGASVAELEPEVREQLKAILR